MRIVHIIPSLIKGGAERIALDICGELAQRKDVEVLLLLLRPQLEYENRVEALTVRAVPASVQLSVFRKPSIQISKLQEALDTFKPDVIHSHLFEAEVVSRSVHYPSAAWFSHGHDNMVQLELPGADMLFNKVRFTNWWERRYLLNRYRVNGGSSFIAISRDVEAFFKRVLPADLADITLLPNAINVRRFNNPGAERRNDNGTAQLINVGSFVAKKNQMFLVLVMQQLVAAGANVHLTFLGDGPLRPEVEALVKQLGIARNITLAGKVSDVEERLWQSDLYVHSALYEPFGLVLVEAMAAGVPVLALDGRGNCDIIKQGINGFIEPNDVTTYANRIIELLKNKALYKSIKEQGLLTAEKYDLVNYVDELLKLYNKAVERKRAR